MFQRKGGQDLVAYVLFPQLYRLSPNLDLVEQCLAKPRTKYIDCLFFFIVMIIHSKALRDK